MYVSTRCYGEPEAEQHGNELAIINQKILHENSLVYIYVRSLS